MKTQMGKKEANMSSADNMGGDDLDTGGWCYLMVEKKSEKLGVPEGWDHIELGDFTAHSKYPTLVGEIQNGFVKIFGRRPGNRLYAGA